MDSWAACFWPWPCQAWPSQRTATRRRSTAATPPGCSSPPRSSWSCCPGLALFYGGLVRRKNVLSTIMHSFFGLALVSVVWVLIGFSLAFAPDANILGIPGLIGGLDFAGFMNVGLDPVADLRHDDPVRPFRRVPADVRRDHAGPDHRRLRRAEALRELRALHAPLVGPRLLADRPLGLGVRRLALQAGRARLRRRHRRPRLVRRVGADRGAADRAAGRQRRPDGAPRHPDDRPGRRPALVRLVRVQRRLRANGRRPRGERAARDEHRGRGRDDHLGPRELHPQAQGRASSARPAARSPASLRSPRRRAS